MSYAAQEEKFATLSRREKMLVFASGLIATFSIVFFLLIEPAFISANKANRAGAALSLEMNSLTQQELLYKEALAEDPNAELKKQIAHVDKRMARLQADFSAQLADLILPRQMPVLIEQVFSQAEGLALTEMASVTPENIFADNLNMQEVPLYQHGVRLTFEGRYFAVRNFLVRLEQLTNRVYWRSMAYKVKEYPTAEVTLEVYTLSTEKAFIGVE